MTPNNDNPWDNDGDEERRPAPPPSEPARGPRPGPANNNGGGTIPDPYEMLRKGQESLRSAFPGMGGGGGNGAGPAVGGMIGVIAVAAAALWLLSGFYRVESDQTGIELTFGKWTNQTNPSEPGLHYQWPYPIGSVEKPVITRENRVTVGFAASGGNFYERSARRDIPEESLMLTSDENIVDIDFLVFWRIKNGGEYLFNTRNPDDLTKGAAESVMREIVGQRRFTDVMSGPGRVELQVQTMQRLQALLDSYKAGVLVQNVQLLDVLPPPPVVDAFNDVQRAQTEKVRLQNEAETYRNNIVPRARGLAEQLRQQAEAYKAEVVSRAQGDAARFQDVYQAYKKSPDVTAKRMYFETMEQVLSGANKVVMGKGVGNVLPYLPLPGGTPGGRTPDTKQGQ